MRDFFIWGWGFLTAGAFCMLAYHLGVHAGRRRLEAERYDSARVEAMRRVADALDAFTSAVRRRS